MIRSYAALASLLALPCCSYDAVLGTSVAPSAHEGPTTLSSADAARLDAPIEPANVTGADVQVLVRSDDPRRHAISPRIYGLRNITDFSVNRQRLFSPAQIRWSTYNWENNASNSGYQTSQNDSGLSDSDAPGDAVRTRIDAASAAGASTVVVVPIGRRVAADKFGTAVVPDGNPSSNFDYLTTRFVENLPDDPGSSGSPVLDDQAVHQGEFLRWLRGAEPDADLVFAMDEEPDLWRSTIAAARPEVLGYAEIAQRNIDFSNAVKRVWPDSIVLGLASYGWTGWELLEDAPTGEQPPDANGPFLEYYLERMRQAEQTEGRRLIDVLDVHWISEARGPDSSGTLVRAASETDATAADARIQAPRSLWDPTYEEDSWIVNDVIHEPIALIPRLRARIDAAYPGTRLAIGSWLFGGDTDISGAIAVADTLGILGREDVAVAALLRGTGYSLLGFRMFTNFDGNGARFGDFSIATDVDDVESASAYAAIELADPDRVTIVLINKRSEAVRFGVRLAHPTAFSRATVYQLDAAAEAIVPVSDVVASGTNAFLVPMPARSVEVLVPES